jgi:hypothetical protein
LLDKLIDIYVWSMGARWRTWLTHSLLAALLLPVVGSWAVIVLFFAREAEQALLKRLVNVPIDWVDAGLDFTFPFLIAILGSSFLGL